MPENGITQLRSGHSFAETTQRLESALKAAGIKEFCRIDHSGEAEKAGLKMQPTQLFIFGGPKAGTPLMIASPSLAIDLPLKALVWQDDASEVYISYNNPEYLQKRHGIPDDLLKNIVGIGVLLQKVV